MPTIQVKDANGTTQTVNTINPNGATNGAASQPVVIASDQAAVPVKIVNPSTGTFGQKLVTNAGTAVVLGPDTSMINGITIKALDTNTGKITVGMVGVTNVVAGTGNGFVIAPGETLSMGISNLNLLYINAVTSGDGVTYAGN